MVDENPIFPAILPLIVTPLEFKKSRDEFPDSFPKLKFNTGLIARKKSLLFTSRKFDFDL